MNTQNDLFDAIYTIATSVVESKNFDITKECKIVAMYTNADGNSTGVYQVKSQDAVYEVYAANGETYDIGDIVYVQIPNGDYDAQKFILGRKIDEEVDGGVYNFQLPLDNFLGLYSLTEYNPLPQTYEYWANDPSCGISGEDISDLDLLWTWEQDGTMSIYATHLGIEVNLTTLLHGYSPISGKYGFRIIVSGTTTDGDLTKEYYFTNDNMYGNPYAYTDGSAQQLLIDIRDFLQILEIRLYFWQDHDFKDSLGEAIPYGEVDYEALETEYKEKLAAIETNEEITQEEKDSQSLTLLQWYTSKTNKASYLKNIIVNDLDVFLGILTDDKSEQLVLYTYNPLNYGADPDHEEVRAESRTLRLAWIHKVDKGIQLINTDDEVAEINAKIYWYKYDETWTSANEDYDETQVSHRFGGINWRPINSEGKLVQEITPNTERTKDRYKAVVHYDGTYITSNVLIFTNYFDIDAQKAELARNDKIVLRCAIVKDNELVVDDTIGDFYVFDENNNILVNDDDVLFSDVKYFVEPWIKVEDSYQRLADYTDADGNKPEFTVTWQWPESFTMISSFGEITQTDCTLFNNCGDAQFELYNKATRYFYIKPTYNLRYGNNDIVAEIYINGYGTCTIRKTLQFGRAEAFGAEYVPVITIVSPEGNYYVDTNANFKIQCLVYNRKGQLMEESERSNCKFSWKYLGLEGKIPEDNLDRENAANFQGNVISGRIYEANPFVVQVTVSGAAAYDITVRRGVMVCDNSSYMQTHDIICPDRVEFKSDGQQPIWYSAAFEVQKINTEDQNCLIYPEWKINTIKVAELLVKTNEYPIFVLPTGETNQPDDTTSYALAMSKQYLTGSENAYGQQWTEDLLDSDYFTYIYFQDTVDEKTVTVAQAIAFSRNLYPSSLVNEWDGQSLNIDEENSALLSKMISAGTKDYKNRFTGVMMGDWHEKGDESLDVPGLYGFSNGAQTFGFTTEGTGFIGAAGYGRIEFDGRSALISNPTKTCYINLNPRTLNFNTEGSLLDSTWSGIGQQGYSQYFLYCELPVKQNFFNNEDLSDTYWWTTNTWTKKYWEEFNKEEGKDYFIVDPNNGILTTGGIFARFGQIGINTPWIIHDNGLTQKNNYGRVFLGNPEKNPSTGNYTTVWPTFDNGTAEGGEEGIKENFYSFSVANSGNVIQTGVRPDGFLYSQYANLGGWCINDKEIYAPTPIEGIKSFRKQWVSTGYKFDYLNITSETASISFNQGKMIIDGVNGWMGSLSDGFEEIAYPSRYDMLLDYTKGIMKFKKENEDSLPYTAINGTNGSAYFAQGKVYINGTEGLIYCGIPYAVETEDGELVAQTIGGINLGGTELQGSGVYDPQVYSLLMQVAQESDNGNIDSNFTANTIGGDSDSGIIELSSQKKVTYKKTAILSNHFADTSININSTLSFVNNDMSNGLSNSIVGGIQMLFGDNNIAIMEPVTTGYLNKWNIYAQDIETAGDLTILGSGYMNDTSGDNTTLGKIATRPWVSSFIDENVYPRIVTVNNAAAAAMSTARKATEDVKNASVTSVELYTPGVDNGGFVGLGVKIITGDGKEISTPVGKSFAEIHKHADSLTVSEGKIKLVPGGVVDKDSASEQSGNIFAGSDGMSMTAGTDGTVILKITIAGQLGTATFDQADTSYFKKHALESAKMEAVGSTVSKSSHIKITYKDDTTSTMDTNTLSLDEDRKLVVQKNSSDTEVASISVSSVYDTGYKTGWNACRTKISNTNGTYYVCINNSSVTSGTELYIKSGDTYQSVGNADGHYDYKIVDAIK